MIDMDALFSFSKNVLPSPLEEISFYGKSIYLKRDDLIHPEINGNKWRKLRLNIENLLNNGMFHVSSIGGTFSNHLYSLAATGQMFNIKTTGFVKCTSLDLENPILQRCHEMGMTLIPVSRSITIEELELYAKTIDSAFIPEGGSNRLAANGCQEIVKEIMSQKEENNQYILSVGSGGTAAGVIQAMNPTDRVLCLSSFESDSVRQLINNLLLDPAFFQVMSHKSVCGRFGSINAKLLDYAFDFYSEYQIILDPVYNLKNFYFLSTNDGQQCLANDLDNVVVITGGVQGWFGIKYLYGAKFIDHPMFGVVDQLL